MNPETVNLYNGEVRLVYEPTRHLYSVNNKPVMGVTTFTGVLEKPALVPWALNKAEEVLIRRIRPGIKHSALELMDIFKEAKNAHRAYTANAADIGTQAHAWCEQYVKNKLGLITLKPKMPNQKVLKFIIQNFLKWEEQNNIKFLASEKRIYSRQYHYAGTLDCLAIVNGDLAVVDFKTSSGIWDEMRFQVAAYRQAEEEETGEKITASWIVKFSKNIDGNIPIEQQRPFETLLITQAEHERDFRAALGCLAAKNRLLELKRDADIRRLNKEKDEHFSNQENKTHTG